MTKVAVLYGGQSAEREVSLRTGAAVHQALLDAGHDAHLIDVGPGVAGDIEALKPQVAFIALHGRGGEDGAIQGLLETMGVAYTGSGILASSMAMNKIVTKTMLDAAGIPTAPYMVVSSTHNLETKVTEIRQRLKGKLVVKAPTQGSSIGVYFVEPDQDLADAINKAFQYDKDILVEQFITGKEITASVMGNDNPDVLPLIEIVSHTGVYDYNAKYTKGLSDHIIPARISHQLTKDINKWAASTYQVLGCRGLARVDFMIADDDNAYVLEVNTIPGMTETSLFPDAARAAGLTFPQLASQLVKLAVE